MKECDAPSTPSQEKISTEETTLNIEKRSFLASLKLDFCDFSDRPIEVALFSFGLLILSCFFVYVRFNCNNFVDVKCG